jgi:hypothetical protein
MLSKTLYGMEEYQYFDNCRVLMIRKEVLMFTQCLWALKQAELK